MASISKRFTASGDARYDVRSRAGGRAVEETFKRRQDAENRVRQVEAERLRGRLLTRDAAERSWRTWPNGGSRLEPRRASRSRR